MSLDGPKMPTMRHVLLTLSTHGDTDGNDIFPSTRTLADETGLSERSVCTHLQKAEDSGWIERSSKGTGHGWRRHVYSLRIPALALNVVQQQGNGRDSASKKTACTEPDTEGTECHAEDTEHGNMNVLKDVQSTSSVTSPMNSSKTSPASRVEKNKEHKSTTDIEALRVDLQKKAARFLREGHEKNEFIRATQPLVRGVSNGKEKSDVFLEEIWAEVEL